MSWRLNPPLGVFAHASNFVDIFRREGGVLVRGVVVAPVGVVTAVGVVVVVSEFLLQKFKRGLKPKETDVCATQRGAVLGSELCFGFLIPILIHCVLVNWSSGNR